MVSGALVMNPAINNPQSGAAGDQRSGAEEYNDALLSTSAAITANEAASALSPPGGSDDMSLMGHTREEDSDDADADQGYDRDHSYSSSTDHLAQYQHQQDQEQLQPQSPMVTPPTRSYQRTAALDTTVSIGIARRSSHSGSGSGSAHVSERRSSSAGSASAVAAATAGMTYTAVSVGVPHVYRDHSQLPDDDSFIRKKTGGVTQPFPEKLQEMLRAVDGTQDAEIVSWLPHGRAFLVRKPKEFTDVIMPK
jgi:hypothetical protein